MRYTQPNLNPVWGGYSDQSVCFAFADSFHWDTSLSKVGRHISYHQQYTLRYSCSCSFLHQNLHGQWHFDKLCKGIFNFSINFWLSQQWRGMDHHVGWCGHRLFRFQHLLFRQELFSILNVISKAFLGLRENYSEDTGSSLFNLYTFFIPEYIVRCMIIEMLYTAIPHWQFSQELTAFWQCLDSFVTKTSLSNSGATVSCGRTTGSSGMADERFLGNPSREY